MRNEAAQRAGGPGDKLANAALVGFVNRNYLPAAHRPMSFWWTGSNTAGNNSSC